MYGRRVIGRLAGIVGAVVLVGGSFVVGGGAAAAQATVATRTVSTAAAIGVPHEASKVVLPETSFDGPALWTQRGPSAPVGALTVLA